MAYQKGSDMLLKVDISGTFTAVGALTTKSMTLNAEMVDVTNQDSAGKWREALAGAGIQRMAVSGAFIFSDGSAQNNIITKFMAKTIAEWQMIVPGLGTFEGLFQIISCAFSGAHNKEVNCTLTLESAGEITFTAES